MGLPYTEKDIEDLVLKMLSRPRYGYDVINCSVLIGQKVRYPDLTGRSTTRQCILPQIMEESLVKINPGINKAVIAEFVSDLSQDFAGYNTVNANSAFCKIIRSGIKLSARQGGKDDGEIVKLVDFDNPDNNTFVAVSQMRVRFNNQTRRPDIIIFVNGMPLVLVELKKCNQNVLKAYEKNLKVYVHDIPNLFVLNQFCVLSNILETRVGTFNSPYEQFCKWLSSGASVDMPKPSSLLEIEIILERLLQGLFQKKCLLDYIANLANHKPYPTDFETECEESETLDNIDINCLASEEEISSDYSVEEVVFIMEETELDQELSTNGAPWPNRPHLGLIFKNPTDIVLLWQE